MKLAFGKSLRLLDSSDFQAVFDNAPFRASHQFFLILTRPNSFTHPRLGLVIAKKHIRLAVQRNRIKRLIREEFRHQQESLTGLDVIVLSRKGLDGLTNEQFRHQLVQQWQRILKKSKQINTNSGNNDAETGNQ